MNAAKPNFFIMIRAPFLSSIISPIIFSTFLAWHISGQFLWVHFILVLILGICLHIATNVYNDIYDTIQGTDKINVNRNEFSGGSGVLVNHPQLFPKMYWIARISLIGALASTVGLSFLLDPSLRITLILLYLLSAFFSKYYTAAPIKLAYRGWGEISVWFAFGPMAILVAAVSQNLGFHPVICVAMPITGISTLSILLIGQMIDLDADRDTGKWGIAVRRGNRTAAYLYFAIQLLLCVNVIVLSFIIPQNGWFMLFSLIPYLLLWPKILKIILSQFENIDSLKIAAQLNVQLHLMFSLCVSVSILLMVVF